MLTSLNLQIFDVCSSDCALKAEFRAEGAAASPEVSVSPGASLGSLGAVIPCAPAALADPAAPIPAVLARMGKCPVLSEQPCHGFMRAGHDVDVQDDHPLCVSPFEEQQIESLFLLALMASDVVLWSD